MSDLGTTQTGLEAETERLLASARATISDVPFCWVVTPAENCGANARVVKTSGMAPVRISGCAGSSPRGSAENQARYAAPVGLRLPISTMPGVLMSP